ncbi:MAG: hypothetical protein ACYC0H_24005 [Solirubrobacteraceae bacterium]
MAVTLRAEQPSDLELLTRGDSSFDDFGPRPIRTTVRSPLLDEPGGLVVEREGRVRGAQWRDGAYRDGFLYAVLRADTTKRS